MTKPTTLAMARKIFSLASLTDGTDDFPTKEAFTNQAIARMKAAMDQARLEGAEVAE